VNKKFQNCFNENFENVAIFSQYIIKELTSHAFHTTFTRIIILLDLLYRVHIVKLECKQRIFLTFEYGLNLILKKKKIVQIFYTVGPCYRLI
jgi:hypothetical protein